MTVSVGSVYNVFAITVYSLNALILLYQSGISHYSPNVERKKEKASVFVQKNKYVGFLFFFFVLEFLKCDNHYFNHLKC